MIMLDPNSYFLWHQHCVCDIIQDEKALYEAARRGDVSVVRRMIATNINVNCTPYEV